MVIQVYELKFHYVYLPREVIEQRGNTNHNNGPPQTFHSNHDKRMCIKFVQYLLFKYVLAALNNAAHYDEHETHEGIVG